MALFASIFALLGRFVGRVLTTTLGWASVMLFGRIPQDRQIWLAVLTFGSIAWVATVAGVLMPDVGTVLLAAVPRPGWIPASIVQQAMLATAILLPAVLGGVTLMLFDPSDRPRGTALAGQVARGYAIVPALAVTLVVLAVAGTIRKVNALAHRRQDAHIAIVVRPGRYDALVAALEKSLRDGELVSQRGEGPTILTTPARVLARLSGRGIGRLVPDRLIELQGPNLVVSIYPADLALTGSEDAVAKARALVARDIPSRDAWFTTTREAQQVEDRLAALGNADPVTRAAGLPDIDRALLDLTVDQDTFEVLYRRRLQLAVGPALDVRDDDTRDGAVPGREKATMGQAPIPGEAPASTGEARTVPGPAPAGRGSLVGSIVGLAVAILAALDIIVTVVLRRSGRATGSSKRDRNRA
jgi:hypothetical protein